MRLPRVRSFLKDLGPGARFLLSGLGLLLRRPRLWKLLIAPVLINATLFAAFVLIMGAVLQKFLSASIPDNWWGALLFITLIVTGILFIALLSIPLFVLIGTIIAAPFYDKLALEECRARGAVFAEMSWWEECKKGLRQSMLLFGWYLFVQGALVLLWIVPFVGGVFSVAFLGFAVGSVFLAVEYIGFSPAFRAWPFSIQRRWCKEHLGLLTGFGAATAFGLAIPGLNLIIPAAAVVGGVKLMEEFGSHTNGHFEIQSRA